MNNKVMFSSKNDIWETPQDFFEKLDEEFNFDCDVCALPENAKCKKYYTPEQDGLKQKWVGVCYMNPPYGKKIKEWVKKAYESDTIVVALLPARTDTKWFHDYIYGKSEIRFLRGRLKFGGVKNSAPFPSMVVIFNKQAKRGKKNESETGTNRGY